MAYSLVSATSPKDLLAKFVVFAAAQGWTVEYDESGGIGTDGGQIALTSGACHMAMGEETSTQNPIVVHNNWLDVDYNDGRLYMALAKSINVANKHFWGHPGSLVTTSNDGDRIRMNDLWGPLTEVHFFGDATYINVLIKCAADRFAHFGFGNIDQLGLSVPQTGYAFGTYFAYWDSSNFSGTRINAQFVSSHTIPFLADGGSNAVLHLNILDNTLDTSIGFVNHASIIDANNVLPVIRTFERGNFDDGAALSTWNVINDMYANERNQPTTGGVQLHRIPIVYHTTDNLLFCYLGEIPGLRYCHIDDLPISSEYEYGSEIYKVFPWKRKGIYPDGILPGYNGLSNTYGLGIAFKKVV